MKKIILLPLLLTLVCTLASNSGKYSGMSNRHHVKACFYATKFAVSEPGMLRKSEVDTIPESELVKIKNEDIESVSVIKDIIIVRLKNGDSVIARKENNIKKRKKKAASEYDIIFSKLEEEATYPGGSRGWMMYLNRTFRYPKEAVDNSVQGTVTVQFIVDKKGKVSDVQAVSGPTTGGLRHEAIRVIKGSGNWISGRQNGEVVKSYKKQTITFMLEPH